MISADHGWDPTFDHQAEAMPSPRYAVRHPLFTALSRSRSVRPSAATAVGFATLLVLALGPAGSNPADAGSHPGSVGAARAAVAGTDQIPAMRSDHLGQDGGGTGSGAPGPTAAGTVRPAATSGAKPRPSVVLADVGPAGATGALGIPVMVLQAYHRAADVVAASDPACKLPWWLLAGIGHTESGHAESGRLTADGTTRGPILGPVLNGGIAGDAVIRDTDAGRYDGDTSYDRAVGPMQFIPSTWANWGVDGNGDGKADPNNIFDATLAAGHYLCADGRDLSTVAGRAAAVLSYNHSQAYLDTVIAWATAYRDGTIAVPDESAPVVVDVVTVRPPLQARPPKRPQAVSTASPGPKSSGASGTTGASGSGSAAGSAGASGGASSTAGPGTTGTVTGSPAPTTGAGCSSPPTTATTHASANASSRSGAAGQSGIGLSAGVTALATGVPGIAASLGDSSAVALGSSSTATGEPPSSCAP
jgi:membrane-bound lytic murein transglycosylase B